MKIQSKIKEQCLQESKDRTLFRSKERSDAHGEVFTPTELVLEMLEQLPDEQWLEGRTFLDPTCGNGQFLAAVLIVKQSLGHKNALSTVYGVDLMPDNVSECQERLLAIAGDTAENQTIVKNNILCRNGLEYDYSFGTSPLETLFDWS